MSVIGFDTSNYTTSIAFFDGSEGDNESRLLPVPSKPGSHLKKRRFLRRPHPSPLRRQEDPACREAGSGPP